MMKGRFGYLYRFLRVWKAKFRYDTNVFLLKQINKCYNIEKNTQENEDVSVDYIKRLKLKGNIFPWHKRELIRSGSCLFHVLFRSSKEKPDSHSRRA